MLFLHNGISDTTQISTETVMCRWIGVTELAKCGWIVEIYLISERKSDSRFFAFETHEAGDAEEAILRYPGIIREDKRTARRRLSDVEIACLRLREDGVRPYILGVTIPDRVATASSVIES
jgi:hypothetical protein